MRRIAGMLGELYKVRIAAMATATAAMGAVVASGGLHAHAALGLAGVFLLACGAGGLNEAQEHAIDARMPRTRRRPIPTRRLTPARGAALSLAAIAAGALLLGGVSATALALGVATVAWYNGVYTLLKRVSSLAAIPGGVVGALPPVIGYVCAGGSPLDPAAVALGVFFFVWQVPHYWILLMRIGHEYRDAGLPSLLEDLGRERLARLTFVWIAATGAVAMMLPLFVPSHAVLVAVMGAATLWMMRAAAAMVASGGAVMVFREINVYALVVMMLVSVGGIIG